MEKVVALKNLNGEENKTVKNVSTRKEDEKNNTMKTKSNRQRKKIPTNDFQVKKQIGQKN
jgi:hypothetical protein